MKAGAEMEKVSIKTEYIKLDQFLKWTGITGSGAEAKDLIADGSIRVNGETELKRGKKLRPGDKIDAMGKAFIIE
jgi:ribosome-associated protein